MTFLAVHLRPEALDVVTDSLGYTRDVGTVSHATKALYFPHLRAAVFGNGSHYVALRYKTWATALDLDGDVDDLADQSTEVLEVIWADFLRGRPDLAQTPTQVMMAGWSERRGRMAGFAFAAGDEGFPADANWMKLDLFDVAAHVGHPDAYWMLGPQRHSDFMATPNDIPTEAAGWVDLAQRVRAAAIKVPAEERIIIGGELLHTRVERDRATQTIIHRFDDTGDEFAQLTAGTANPAGAPHKWTGVGRNDLCPCSSGRKYKHCHDPRAGSPSLGTVA